MNYTVQGAMEYLGFTDSHRIYQAIYDKQLEASKQGTKWSISRQALDTYWYTHIFPAGATPPPGSIKSQQEEVTVNNTDIEETEVKALEEQPIGETVPFGTLGETMHAAANAARRLKTLGVPLEHIDEILPALHDYERLQVCVGSVRDQQFCNEARNLLKALDTGGDAVMLFSAYLRRFAEHVAAQAMASQFENVADVVDRVSCMTETQESEE